MIVLFSIVLAGTLFRAACGPYTAPTDTQEPYISLTLLSPGERQPITLNIFCLYRQPPQFHASVCWWADGELMTAAQLARVQARVDAAGLDDACMPVGAVRCKLGDKIYDIQLG